MIPGAKCFVVSCKRNSQRAEACVASLAAHGLSASPVWGIDRFKACLFTHNVCELSNPHKFHRMGPTIIAILLSHLVAWRVASFFDNDSFVFFEDDARLEQDWQEHINQALLLMESDWDLLFPGSCCAFDHPGVEPVQGRLHRVRALMCLHCVIVRKKALEVLFDAASDMQHAVDVLLAHRVIPRLKTYAILPQIVRQFHTQLTP